MPSMEDWLSVAARSRPDHPAVEAPEGTLTYRQLDAAADRSARRLAALGLGEDDRVATTLPPGLDFVALLHACMRARVALVPLNTRLPGPGQRAQADLAAPSLTVDEPLEGEEASDPPPGPLPGAVLTVVFTSGTTGTPKPVPLTVANHAASAAAAAAALGTERDDRWLCPLPLFHVGGLGVAIRTAIAGATVVFDRPEALDRVTLASLVATQLARLREDGFEPRRPPRALLLGGGPVSPDLLAWARERGLPARPSYGMTETCSQVAIAEPWEVAARPGPGVELRIGPDEEILVRGPMVSAAALSSDGWLHTGDTGLLDDSGRLRVHGRIKDLIVTGGENVVPEEVERALLAHPSVADAGVAGEPSTEWGEEVVAFVVETGAASDDELRAFLDERLAGYQVPKRFVRLDALPRNAAGKLLRRELPL